MRKSYLKALDGKSINCEFGIKIDKGEYCDIPG